MIGVLHGLWLGDAFFCYVMQEGRLLHPREWKQRLASALPKWRSMKERTALLWLPDDHRGGHLHEVSAAGIAVSALDSFHFLAACQDQQRTDLCKEMAFGPDIDYWQHAALFVWHLAKCRKMVPGIEVFSWQYETESMHSTGKPFSGRGMWRPDLSEEEDRRQFEQLAAAMPPSCAAYMPEPGHGKGWMDHAPRHILHAYVSCVLDEWAREETGPSLLRDLNRRLGRNHPAAGTVEMQWWRAMLSPAARAYLSSPLYEAEKLERTLNAWLNAYSPVPPRQQSVRRLNLALRLAPPEALLGEQPWQLQFFLYPEEDPSLLLPAEEIWQMSASGDVLWENVRFHNAPAMLLDLLSKAGHIYPKLVELLFTNSAPHKLDLNADEAYIFLSEFAERLSKQGYVVQLPSWWTRDGSHKARGKVKLNIMEHDWSGVGGIGLHRLLEFDAVAALGGETVSLHQLKTIARLKSPLIPFRGRWIEVDQESVRETIAFLESRAYTEKKMTWQELLHLHARTSSVGNAAQPSLELELQAPPIVVSFLEGDWRQIVQQRKVPENLLAKLRPYQERGFQWMALMRDMGFGMCLADDMGLGKTVQVITLLLEQTLTQPALIVCPTSVLWNWQKELERFAPSLRVMIHHGPERLHGPAFESEARQAEIVLTTYPLLMRDEADFHRLEWSYFILDEAQYIKNRKAKQTMAVIRLRSKAKTRAALTGTPMENRLSELWSVLDFLNPGLLGESKQFQDQYAIPIEKEGDEKRTEQLKKLVAPFILRRLKSDPEINKELPEKVEMKSYCTLTLEQASLYQAVMDRMLADIDAKSGMQRRGHIMAGLNELKQICNHPALFLRDQSRLKGRSGKLKRLQELIDAVLAADESALIFTQYARMGHLLTRFIKEQYGMEPPFLHGGVPSSERAQMIASFQEGASPPLFVLSLKAGGVGLNLTRANHVIHYDRWWNPAVEDQATDRAFRIGQRRNVHVHKMICHGTLEERIDEMLEAKKDLLNTIVGSGEHWMTELSNDELRQLIELRHPLQ